MAHNFGNCLPPHLPELWSERRRARRPVEPLLPGDLRTISLDDEPINGDIKIGDSLDIETGNGPIDVNISVNHLEIPIPAKLRIRSINAPIKVTFEGCSIGGGTRCRVLDIDIHSTSGNITALLPHWYNTSLTSDTGDITAKLVPHGLVSRRSDITVDSSGNKNVTVVPHCVSPGAPLPELNIACGGYNGNLKLVCSRTWLGQVRVHTKEIPPRIDWLGMKLLDGGMFKSKTSVRAEVGDSLYQGQITGKIQAGHVFDAQNEVEIVGKDFDIEAAARKLLPEGGHTVNTRRLSC